MTDSPDQTKPSEAPETAAIPADSALSEWLKQLPETSRPYVALARLDRPVGIWLLLLPCFMGIALMRIQTGFEWIDIWWAILFTIGAVTMRGAGCTWNDITDREADAQVTRTAARPLPSGQVTVRNASLFLAAQLAIGFLVWLCLPFTAKLWALAAIPLVVAYPFMKRITWWPQAWLGFTFNWGILVAAATIVGGSLVNFIQLSTLLVYLGLICWTIAYDTTYALQDREDDALIGVRSTARLFDNKVLTGIFVFHLLATALIALGAWVAGAGRIGAAIGILFMAHGLWQITKLSADKEGNALAMFKSNVWAGALIVIGLSLAVIL